MSVRCVLGRLYTRETRRFHLPGKQAVSVGSSVYSAAQMLRDRRRRKPLVILETDAQGELLFRAFEENDIVWSSFVLPAPRATAESAVAAGQLYRAQGCDCILALGGLPAVDTAKAAAAWLAKPGILKGKKPYRRLNAPMAPMIFVIPCRVDGSFSSGEAVVYDEGESPCTLSGKKLVPSVVLLDPVFLENASRKELADEGLAGLCRAVEAYIAPGKGDLQALTMAARAVRGYFENLEPCWNDGGTPAQRSGLMEAARLAGLASYNLGYGHAGDICRGLCRVGVAPGEAYGAILPCVLEKYGNIITEKLSRLSSLSGVMNTGSQQERAAALICRIRDLAFRMGLSETLPPVGKPDLDGIAYVAANNIHSLPPVNWSEEKCRKILETVVGFSDIDT